MPEPKGLVPLLAALRGLVEWLDATGTPGVVVGGVAASLLGKPRVTGDVDALILLDEAAWASVVAAAEMHGITPRRPDALAFARRTRVLLLSHEPSGIHLDVSVGALPFEEEVVARARWRRILGVRVPVATPEDIVVMKAVAHRARDLADIEGIVAVQGTLDRARVRRIVREFAAVLEAPEIVEDLERTLATRPARPRRRSGSPRRSGRR